MVIRTFISIFVVAVFMTVMPIHAFATDTSLPQGLSAVKVLNYSQLMRLSDEQRVQYIAGLRGIVTEVEELQTASWRSKTEKKELGAKIEFLKLFIQDAEAMGGGSGASRGNEAACSTRFAQRPGVRAHTAAGLKITCYNGVRHPCPAGTVTAGAANGQVVCFDNRHESRSRWLANRAKLHLDNSRFVHAATKPAIVKHVAVHKLAGATAVVQSHIDAAVRRPTTGARRRDVASADAESAPSAAATVHDARPARSEKSPVAQTPDARQAGENEREAYQRLDSEAEVKKGEAFDKKVAGGHRNSADAAAAAGTADFTAQTADELSAGGDAASDIIDRETDSNGDVHITRRKIADFEMLKTPQEDKQWKDDKTASLIDASCEKEIPTTSEAPKETCNDRTRAEAVKKLAVKGEPHCFAAGNLSHFKNNAVHAHNCQPPREFCLNRISCRESNGAMAPHAQVNFSCKTPGEIICNPYIFNLKPNDEPICVRNETNATRECAAQATALNTDARPFFRTTSATNGVYEGWNEFADEFNRLCSADGLKDYYCAECQIIKYRLYKLHRLVLKSADTADTCAQMSKLILKKGSSPGTATPNRPPTPAASSAPAVH